MKRPEFETLFRRALEQAAAVTERATGTALPRTFVVELHGAGVPGDRMNVEDAIGRLYPEEGRFFRLIDVGMKAIANGASVAFVRVSDFPEGPWEQTWNPSELGPFKIILPAALGDETNS